MKPQLESCISLLCFRSGETQESLLYELEKQGVYIGNGYFIMMMLTLSPLSDEIVGDKNNQLEQLHQIIGTILNNRELFYPFQFGGHNVCLICYPHISCLDEADRELPKISKYLKEIQEEGVRHHLSFSVIISPFMKSTQCLSALLDHCLDTYSYFSFMENIPSSYIAAYDHRHDSSVAQYEEMKRSAKYAVKLATSLQSRNNEECHSLLPQIYDSIMLSDVHSLRIVHYRFFSFLNQLVLMLDDMNITSKSFLAKHGIFNMLNTASTRSELQEQFEAFVHAAYMEAQKRSVHNSAAKSSQGNEILAFIDDNLCDSTLDVSMLSRIFNMSQALVSASFKKQHGISPSDYIRRSRIELVKHDLETTEMTLQEISSHTGFASISTMQRVFRKAVGMPPGQYRLQCRIEQNP